MLFSYAVIPVDCVLFVRYGVEGTIFKCMNAQVWGMLCIFNGPYTASTFEL